MSNHLKKNIVALFNAIDMVPNNKYASSIAEELNITYDTEKEEWAFTATPRVIQPLGIPAAKALNKFMQIYRKGYRLNKIADAFYKLTDEEIDEMFIELPFYMKTIGDPHYQLTAERFLAEKIWQTNYPFKPKGDRTRDVNFNYNDWDSFLASVPTSMKEAYTLWRDNMTWEQFKTYLANNHSYAEKT